MSRFYSVRFQVPLAWKLFFFIGTALTFLTIFSSDFRKLAYDVIPSRYMAGQLNSKIIDDASSHMQVVVNRGVIYSVSKHKVLKFGIESGNTDIFLDKRSKPFSCMKIFGDNVYVGDWYGSIYKNHGDKEWRVIKAPEKCRIIDIFEIDKRLIISTSAGIMLKGENSSNLTRGSLNGRTASLIAFDGGVYTVVNSQLMISNDAGSNWEEVLSLSQEQGYISDITSAGDKGIALLTRKGLYCFDGSKLSQAEFSGSEIICYSRDDEVEVAVLYKSVMAVRKKGGPWLKFSSPAGDSRSVNAELYEGFLWLSVYQKGLYKINVKRLMELEGSK